MRGDAAASIYIPGAKILRVAILDAIGGTTDVAGTSGKTRHSRRHLAVVHIPNKAGNFAPRARGIDWLQRWRATNM